MKYAQSLESNYIYPSLQQVQGIVADEEINGELVIFCRLIYEEKDLASKADSKLIVRTEGVRR